MRQFFSAASALALVVAAASCAHDPPIDQPDSKPISARVPLHCPPVHASADPAETTEPHRTSGGPNVPLSDETLVELHYKHYDRLTVKVEACVDRTGDVSCIDFGAAPRPRVVARTIVEAVQDWKYVPAMVAGQAVASCFPLTFNYKIQ